MTLTPEEIESLRIAIADGFTCTCGYGNPSPTGRLYHLATCQKELPYTTSLDAIQKAAMERFKTDKEQLMFESCLSEWWRSDTRILTWQLTALDWAIAFARTAKIWRFKV